MRRFTSSVRFVNLFCHRLSYDDKPTMYCEYIVGLFISEQLYCSLFCKNVCMNCSYLYISFKRSGQKVAHWLYYNENPYVSLSWGIAVLSVHILIPLISSVDFFLLHTFLLILIYLQQYQLVCWSILSDYVPSIVDQFSLFLRPKFEISDQQHVVYHKL